MHRKNPNPFGVRGDGSISRRDFMATAATLGAALSVPGMPTSALAQAQTFKLGWIRPTTGRLASGFAPSYAGGLVAIEEINAAGGIMGRTIERLEEDDEASPAKEPAIVRKLHEAGVNVICGPTGSSQSLAMLASTTQRKIISGAFGTATEVGDAKYPYQFLCNLTTGMQGEAAVTFLAERLGLKKIAIIRENSAYGEQATAASVAAMQRYGLKPVADEIFPMTAPDLNAYVINAQKSGAEGVLAWIAGGAPASMMLTTMNAMGWLPPVVGNTSLFLNVIQTSLPPAALKNVYSTLYKPMTWSDSEKISERHKALAAKITELVFKDGKPEHNGMASPFYDFLYILKMVIEGQKSFDVDAIKKGFEEVKGYEGVLGKFTFGPDRHSGLEQDSLVIATVSSGTDPQAMGYFRQRA